MKSTQKSFSILYWRKSDKKTLNSFPIFNAFLPDWLVVLLVLVLRLGLFG